MTAPRPIGRGFTAIHAKNDEDSIPLRFVRDEMKARGRDINNFSRWVSDLCDKHLIYTFGEGFIRIPSEEISEECSEE